MYIPCIYILFYSILFYSILFNKQTPKHNTGVKQKSWPSLENLIPTTKTVRAWWRRTTSWCTSTCLVEKLNKHDKKATWWKNMIIYAWVNYHSFTILDIIECIVTSCFGKSFNAKTTHFHHFMQAIYIYISTSVWMTFSTWELPTLGMIHQRYQLPKRRRAPWCRINYHFLTIFGPRFFGGHKLGAVVGWQVVLEGTFFEGYNLCIYHIYKYYVVLLLISKPSDTVDGRNPALVDR